MSIREKIGYSIEREGVWQKKEQFGLLPLHYDLETVSVATFSFACLRIYIPPILVFFPPTVLFWSFSLHRFLRWLKSSLLDRCLVKRSHPGNLDVYVAFLPSN